MFLKLLNLSKNVKKDLTNFKSHQILKIFRMKSFIKNFIQKFKITQKDKRSSERRSIYRLFNKFDVLDNFTYRKNYHIQDKLDSVHMRIDSVHNVLKNKRKIILSQKIEKMILLIRKVETTTDQIEANQISSIEKKLLSIKSMI